MVYIPYHVGLQLAYGVARPIARTYLRRVLRSGGARVAKRAATAYIGYKYGPKAFRYVKRSIHQRRNYIRWRANGGRRPMRFNGRKFGR
jgi:hypothetical protein